MTALLDAVGQTIDEVGERLAQTPEQDRPEKVVFVILTDGQENSSVAFSYDDIRRRIQHQENKYNWEFVFLGVGLEGFSEAANIGVRSDMSHHVADTPEGVNRGYANTSETVSSSKA